MSEPFSIDPQESLHAIESDPEVPDVVGLNRAGSETLRSLNSKAKIISRFTSHPSSTTISTSRSTHFVRGGLRQSMVASLSESCTMPHKSYVPKYFDSTGCFHWVPDTPIERVKLVCSYIVISPFDCAWTSAGLYFLSYKSVAEKYNTYIKSKF